MASTTSSGCPGRTAWPSVTLTETTVPGMGERIVASALSARFPRVSATSSSDSAQAWPPRPSHIIIPLVA
jgi:hypothetical protein